MPVFPAEVADAREVATLDEIEEQIVTFDETARTAILKDLAECRTIIRVFVDADTRERNATENIDPNVAARFFDLAQVRAIAVGFPVGEVVADAAAAATLLSLAFATRVLFVIRVATWASAAVALELTIPHATAVFAVDRPERVTNAFARVVPFLVLTAA